MCNQFFNNEFFLFTHIVHLALLLFTKVLLIKQILKLIIDINIFRLQCTIDTMRFGEKILYIN